MIECVRRTSRNVKHWQSGDMCLRWAAPGCSKPSAGSGGSSATPTSPSSSSPSSIDSIDRAGSCGRSARRPERHRGGRYARHRVVVTPGPPSKFHGSRGILLARYGMTDYDWRTSEAADCRRWRASRICSPTIIGEEEEVVHAAVEHSASVHEHGDTPELRQQVRRLLEPLEAGILERPRAKEPMPADRRSEGAPRRCLPRRAPPRRADPPRPTAGRPCGRPARSGVPAGCRR